MEQAEDFAVRRLIDAADAEERIARVSVGTMQPPPSIPALADHLPTPDGREPTDGTSGPKEDHAY